ncbi:MAG: tRNA (adenosine(37)-N6)-threonylcarbamoyltransferase complex ATPase subunit type 1 TsaE [Microcoleaceae cyanobacterium]
MTDDLVLSLPNADATYKLGKQLGQLLPSNTVVLLQGNLGSGKTTLVQGMGRGLGITEPIDSPTFTLINEYHSGRIPLYHIDLYRLNSGEIRGLNLEIYWEGIETEPGIVAIEWAERLTESIPRAVQIFLAYQLLSNNLESRQARITAPPEFIDANRLITF